LKARLEYELATRGVKSAGQFQLLRRIFLSMQAENLPSNVQNLRDVNVSEVCDDIHPKLEESENMVE
jgi:hypothetical protein